MALSADPVGDLLLEPLNPDMTAPTEVAAQAASPTVDYGLDYVRQTYGFLGAGQTVAIIDSGVAYDHPALGGGFGPSYRVVGGWDFAENDADPYDDGPGGFHGTHVAGIFGSADLTYRGVAPGVDLVALRVFDDRGRGEIAWVEQALQWVHQHRAAFENPITTVNLSLGTEWNGGQSADTRLEDELAQLHADGIFVVASAGNSFATHYTVGLSYPAASPFVTPVASVGADGTLSDFSQRDSRVLAAPGERITSTVPDYAFNLDGRTDDFERSSGTSMAAPYVAGAGVLVRDAMLAVGRTDVTPELIYQHLRDTADLTFDPATNASYHRIHVGRAIDAIMASATPVDWGEIAFTEYAGEEISGEARRSLRASRDGVLTIEAFFAHAAGNVDLELYDAHGRMVTSSRAAGDMERIDATAAAGETFSLKIIGANGDVDFRLTNLVSAASGVIEVHGTNRADSFSFATGTQHIIEVNGVTYQWNAGDYRTVRIHGGNGEDRISVTGASGDERLTARPGEVSFAGAQFSLVAENVEIANIRGGGGRDEATLYDSYGHDRLEASPTETRLRGDRFDHRAAGFASVEIRAGAGYDMAFLADSPGDDVFTARPDSASLEGSGYRVGLAGFDQVRGAATGGRDRAVFYDSAGADRFFARPGLAWVTGRDYLNFSSGFDAVHAYAAAGGYDMAWLFDSRNDDRLTVRTEEVRLTGPEFDHAAIGYDAVRAVASNGGGDRAEFFRAAGDTLAISRGEAMLSGAGHLHIATNFAHAEEMSVATLRQTALEATDFREEERRSGELPVALASVRGFSEDAPSASADVCAVAAVFDEYGA